MSKGKSKRKFSEEFKLSVLRDYYESGMTRYACSRKYEITFSTLVSWLKKYGEAEKSVSSRQETQQEEEEAMSRRSNEDYREEVSRLRKRVRELEKALAYSKLETESRDVMINIAEKLFDIPIRKKPGAKQ